jgi:urease accessory protein
MAAPRALADSGLSAPPRVGRDGALRLGFERRRDATVLAGCRWTLPLQVLAPLGLPDPASVVSVLNPTGGVLGGDRLRVDIEVGQGAHACLTTPSATKVYRTAGEPAVQAVRLVVGPGATLEWVPDHTIPFAGSDFRQTIEADVADGGCLVLVDAFSAGRIAAGERWRFRRLESALTVRGPRGELVHDRFVLFGAADGLGATEGADYFATLVVVAGRGLDALADEAPGLAAATAGARAAGGRLETGALVVRCLAPSAPALLDALGGLWDAARRLVLGLAPLALRKP